MSQHASHPEVVKRLKRADGHLRGIIEMIEAGHPCLDLAQQLHAVKTIAANAKGQCGRDFHCGECYGLIL